MTSNTIVLNIDIIYW